MTLGGRRLVELSAADIGEALDQLTCGAATANRYLTVLKHVLSIARREWEWVVDNPATRARARKEPRGRLRYLSEEERRRLLARATSTTRMAAATTRGDVTDHVLVWVVSAPPV